MATDEEALRAANRKFYDALQGGDLAAIRGVWSAEGMVSCVHPGTVLIAGWEDVMESWSILLEDIAQWELAIEERWIDVRGDLGWVLSVERYEAPDEEEGTDEISVDESGFGEGGDEGEVEGAPPEDVLAIDAPDDEDAPEWTRGEAHAAHPSRVTGPTEPVAATGVSEPIAVTTGEEEEAIAAELDEAEAARGLEEAENEGEEEGEEDDEEEEDEGRRLVMATHVFQREDGDWKLVHRHASPAPPSDDAPSLVRARGEAN